MENAALEVPNLIEARQHIVNIIVDATGQIKLLIYPLINSNTLIINLIINTTCRLIYEGAADTWYFLDWNELDEYCTYCGAINDDSNKGKVVHWVNIMKNNKAQHLPVYKKGGSDF